MANRSNTLTLRQPPVDTEWRIEQSWLVHHPASINTDSLPELRSRLQALADDASTGRPPGYEYGALAFRYECDSRDFVTVVHAYFVGRNGLNKRFMKLRRT